MEFLKFGLLFFGGIIISPFAAIPITGYAFFKLSTGFVEACCSNLAVGINNAH